MVAGARLLEPLEVRVEVLLAEERGPVDARELRVVRVAAPVGARERGELERLDRRRGLQVRAAAEVGEVALRVERDRTLGRVDELDLVRLALRREPRARLVGRDLLALPRAPLGELALHLGLDRLEIGVVDRRRELEVVVEAVVDRRPDRDLDARMKPAHRLGEQVGGGVAQHGERVGILRVARRQDLELRAVGQRQPQVLRHAVRLDQHGLLGELRADRARSVETAGAVGELELGRIGKDDLHARRIVATRGRGSLVRAIREHLPGCRRQIHAAARLRGSLWSRAGRETSVAGRLRPATRRGACARGQGPRRRGRTAAHNRARQARRPPPEGERPPPLPARQVRPRPSLVARPHGAHEPPAHGADDARLARLVRDVERDGRLAAADDPAEQPVPPLGPRLVPGARHARDRRTRRCCCT